MIISIDPEKGFTKVQHLLKIKTFQNRGIEGTFIKTVWCWYKNRNRNQWNRIENPEINPCIYGQLIYDKEGKTIQCWKEGL